MSVLLKIKNHLSYKWLYYYFCNQIIFCFILFYHFCDASLQYPMVLLSASRARSNSPRAFLLKPLLGKLSISFLALLMWNITCWIEWLSLSITFPLSHFQWFLRAGAKYSMTMAYTIIQRPMCLAQIGYIGILIVLYQSLYFCFGIFYMWYCWTDSVSMIQSLSSLYLILN